MIIADTKPELIADTKPELNCRHKAGIADTKPELITIIKTGAKIPMSHRL